MTTEIKVSGWYQEGDIGGDYELVATNPDEMIDHIDKEGELEYAVIDYICQTYDVEDFVSEIMYDRVFMTKDDMIEDYKKSEIEEGEDVYVGGVWYEWFDEGHVIEDE